jgi:protein-S-isoprenylcysteine O-methyltransferase Ste14
MATPSDKPLAAPLRLLLRIPVPWVFVLCYLAGAGLERLRPTTALAGHMLIGAIVFIAGALIAGWGLLTFRKARTTTVPGEASSSFVTWGPYRFTRNPMYVGLTIAYLGEAGILQQMWPVVLLPLTLIYVNFVVIPLEERKLVEVFDGAYEQYRSRVRRWV